MAARIPHDDEGKGGEQADGAGQAGAGGAVPEADEPRLNEYDLRVHEMYRDENLIGRGRRDLNSRQEKIDRREGFVFPYLARSLSLKVHELDHYFRYNGLPADVIIFALLMRTFNHHLSARRLDYVLERARQDGLIPMAPMPNTLLFHERQIGMTPILENLVGIGALPFRNFDAAYGVDSTPVKTGVYLRDEDGNVVKEGKRKLFKLIKLHVMGGLNSLAIVSARSTPWPVHDIKYFKPLLLDAVARGFKVRSVAADRGYVSKENHRLLREIGAEAFITFKKNSRKSKGGADPEWDEALERFRVMSVRELAAYDERVLIEAIHGMLKKRFGRQVRARGELKSLGDKDRGQYNGALLKAACHNLTRLNQYGICVNDIL
jgi:hypothetical protein